MQPPPGTDVGSGPLRVARLTDRTGLRVVGQVDLAVRGQWEAALAGLAEHDAADVAEDVHLDLTQLTFIDVRGTTALVELAQGLHRGQRLRLYHPPRTLLHILDAVVADGRAAITIEAA